MRFDIHKDAALLAKIKDRSGRSVLDLYGETRKSSSESRKAQPASRKQRKPLIPPFVRDERVMLIVLPYPPSSNNLYVTCHDGKRRLSKEGREYKRRAAIEAIRQKAFKLTGEVELTLWVFRPQKSRDASNCIKAAEDALKSICWYDDEQVAELHVYRNLDRARPRLEVQIKQIPLTSMSDIVK